jgi:hypothetical protein
LEGTAKKTLHDNQNDDDDDDSGRRGEESNRSKQEKIKYHTNSPIFHLLPLLATQKTTTTKKVPSRSER